ncbi:type II toxin-antitoxin system VapC family toxin [Yoonia sp.]|uniref:type II toxin-antitoxin system VapC family toxin n=1 Tax=Yoonia sp. TaxID=2212373 RepID=UPI002DF89030|nr:type II toxin-antitoxin system VapC family toxin [Yoonia sp.]
MIIVDTNVISELLCLTPEPAVEAWLGARDGLSIYLTAISEAELRCGVAIMTNGKRRDGLAHAIDRILRDDMAGRILPFDSAAARAYADIAASRRSAGKPISQADCYIAAFARAHGARIFMRNTPDLKGCEIDLINPWTTS